MTEHHRRSNNGDEHRIISLSHCCGPFPDWSLWLTPIVLGLCFLVGMGAVAAAGVDRLAEYPQANQGDATYLAAAVRATTASLLMLATGEPVMAMGGFSGGDRILTVEKLREMVADGEVRFFLIESQGNRQGDLTRWVTNQCEAVPQGIWGTAPSGGPGEPTQLFDCGAVSFTHRSSGLYHKLAAPPDAG